jgi:uncharacterized protein (DUF1697 family)
MQTWIALFRGINVGGRNKMSMAKLTSALEAAGCRSVQTYIQSGNVVFDCSSKSKPNLSVRLGDAIACQFGFRPDILLLTDSDFRTAIKNNPFPDAESEPKTLHFFFLDSVPDSPDMEAIVKLATATERYRLIDGVFYLHAPEGFGRSKLAAGVERRLGVPVTARNYNTIRSLSSILDGE